MTHGSKWVFCGRMETHDAHGVTCPGSGRCQELTPHEPHMETRDGETFWCFGNRIRLYRERHVTVDGRRLLDTTWRPEPLPVMRDDEIVGKLAGLRKESTGWVTGLLTLTKSGVSAHGLAAQGDFMKVGDPEPVDGVMVMTGAELAGIHLGRSPTWEEMVIP